MPIDLFEAFKAARRNDVPTLREALKTHDVNSTDALGRTFLHHAANALAEDVVDFLLVEAEINPNIDDNNGEYAGKAMLEAWSIDDEIARSIYDKLADHESPFTADSELGNWPRDPSTGMAMSPYRLRKFYPGFLETTTEDEEQAIVSRGPQTPPASGPGVPSPR